MGYEDYKKAVRTRVSEVSSSLHAQPVLLLGAGLSRRYFNAPNWNDLLESMAELCPEIDKPFAYYAQQYGSEPQIASEFALRYRDWAWGKGQSKFPNALFQPSVSIDAFLKHAVATKIDGITPKSLDSIDSSFSTEIEALREIKPHALITTNYDRFLELVFPEHKVVIGNAALRGLPYAVGEIYKIHGCVSEPAHLVLTNEDYDLFARKKKYISARLLTLFSDHPLLICGYSAGDRNIASILADIDEALALPGELIENIFFVEFDPNAHNKSSLPQEKLIQVQENRSVRVNLIVTSDLRWVFDAFKSPETLSSIPPSLMRALLQRSYELVRSDVPRKNLKVNFEFLEQKLESSEEFASLFGLATINDASLESAMFPLSSTELGQKLGGSSWHLGSKAIAIVKQDTGFDIKKSDNAYHRKLRINKSDFHKYSNKAVKLLERVIKEGKCEPDWLELPTGDPTLF